MIRQDQRHGARLPAYCMKNPNRVPLPHRSTRLDRLAESLALSEKQAVMLLALDPSSVELAGLLHRIETAKGEVEALRAWHPHDPTPLLDSPLECPGPYARPWDDWLPRNFS